MKTVTISPKFKIRIPKDIRKNLNITPGQKFLVINSVDTMELIRVKETKSYRGFLKGMDTSLNRNDDRI